MYISFRCKHLSLASVFLLTQLGSKFAGNCGLVPPGHVIDYHSKQTVGATGILFLLVCTVARCCRSSRRFFFFEPNTAGEAPAVIFY
jgi:hypothetical protein